MNQRVVDPVFCVFSFNRPRFLENCVASIEQCVPGVRIIVFDDDSDDPDTVALLKRLGQTHEIVSPQARGDHKHGGLYWNMQAAFERLSDEALICFLQDDCQVVRPLQPGELDQVSRLFADNPELAFVHPCFIRGIDQGKVPVHDATSADGLTYFREDWGQSAGVHYSDLFITSPGRLKANNWRFHPSEPANDRQAREKFGRMAYMRSPFAMWLPEVPAYRGKVKTLALKLAERKKQCGFYPFRIWSGEETDRFLARPADSAAPIAEDFLDCGERTPPRPWTYNPLTGLRFLKQLNNVEQFFRR
ncbi:hypothetical protein CF392_08780 [Tamilnaduibacter salinus]|uniref:Glycosyltransferase 2-like domain-containing protein n=1 Tax=Tamilnaduibacter salinus TaxID=1484056 RepID=A0A2A2I389_9GAMM|nr:glycosyltransferase [Tamilnaduibacter salinus]PAV25878.1 hypothetical protein CF392_08780 [Tamilnaduibacter salinus]